MNKKKILHIAFDDLHGAGKSAYVINKFINIEQKYDSKLLVFKKYTQDKDIYEVGLKEKIYQKVFEKIGKYLNHKNRHLVSFCYFNNSFRKYVKIFKPDIIHIHWLGKEMFSLKEILDLNIKIVWTHRDLWPILGLNHYDENVKLKEQSVIYKNLNKFIFNYKKNLIYKNVTIVAISEWHKSIIDKSFYYKNKEIIKISNAIDTYKYYPKDYIPKNNSFNILFLAHNYINDNRKGYKLFIDIVNKIKLTNKYKKFNFRFIVVGDYNNENKNNDFIFLPHIENENDLNTIYNIANLYVNTSRYETFGKTTAESMACDTPVIAYEKTGAKDMIDHKINGYLINDYTVSDFYNGICWMIDSLLLSNKSFDCRTKILSCFSTTNIIQEYNKIYK